MNNNRGGGIGQIIVLLLLLAVSIGVAVQNLFPLRNTTNEIGLELESQQREIIDIL